jgi:hypothetical protein
VIRETLNYNIHDILTFQINRLKCRDLVKDINLPYSYFESEPVIDPDIVLNIGPFEPQNQDCNLVDYKWHIRKDYIFCSERIGRTAVDVEIIGLENGPTTINVNTNVRKIKQFLFPSVLAQYFILRPIIDFRLLFKGYLSIHAAGAGSEDGAFVFLGRGGTFKTTLTMDYIRKANYKFLGDDRVIVNNDKIYSYPMHIKLFDYRVNRMVTEQYSILDKPGYLFYERATSRNKKTDYVIDKAIVRRFYSIVKSSSDELEFHLRTKQDIVSQILHSHKMETIRGLSLMGMHRGFYDYFTAYSYVFTDSRVAYYWNKYKSLLNEYLKADLYQEIYLPRKYTASTFDQFQSIVQANQ